MAVIHGVSNPQSWCKVASNLDSNPRIRRAGRNGREVFLFALRRNREPNNTQRGYVSAAELEPWYVADQLMMPESDAADGIARCEVAGLLARDGDRWRICGWDEQWDRVPATGAERTAKWRARKSGSGDGVTSPPSPTVTGDVTGDASDGPKVTRDASDESDVGEERRGEENRRDISARARERRPDTGRVAVEVWRHAAVRYGELSTKGIRSPRAWPANPDASSTGWTLLLDRCEAMLVDNTPEDAISIGKRRVDVAFATAIRDGSANHYQPSVMFSPRSFEIGIGMNPDAIKPRDGPRSGSRSPNADGIRTTKILE